MDIYKLMENRRSVRTFSKKDVSIEKIDIILKAGQLSPSGANQKPFVYIVIDDQKLKEEIKKYSELVDKKNFANSEKWFKNWMKEKNISLQKNFLTDAPFLLIVAGEKDKPYWLESTWLSIAYVLLAAENEELSTLTYTPAETEFLIDLLDLPEGLEPVVIIPIGYKKS